MWRPKDWKNPHMEILKRIAAGGQQGMYTAYSVQIDRTAQLSGAYEGGANALFEALKKQGSYVMQNGEKGWTIFIPDDEEPDAVPDQ